MEDKIKRGSNFSQEEVCLLIKLMREKINIITNRRLDKVTWLQKNDAWEDITTKFNAETTSTYRNVHMLRRKYDNLKTSFREKYDLVANVWKAHFDVSLIDELVRDLLIDFHLGNSQSFKAENRKQLEHSDNEDSKSFTLELDQQRISSPELVEVSMHHANEENALHGNSPVLFNGVYNSDTTKKNDVYELELELLMLKRRQLEEEHELKLKLMKDKHMLQMKSLELDILLKKKQLEKVII